MKQIARITLIALLLTASYMGAKSALPTPQSGVTYGNGTAPAAACPTCQLPKCIPGMSCRVK